MYRNFYNLLESQYFLRTFSCWAVWNDGIVECWNTGYKKRKKIYSTKNVVSTFYDDGRQTSIFCFRTRIYANITSKSMQLYSFWFPKPTIPIAERSGAKFQLVKGSERFSIMPTPACVWAGSSGFPALSAIKYISLKIHILRARTETGALLTPVGLEADPTLFRAGYRAYGLETGRILRPYFS